MEQLLEDTMVMLGITSTDGLIALSVLCVAVVSIIFLIKKLV